MSERFSERGSADEVLVAAIVGVLVGIVVLQGIEVAQINEGRGAQIEACAPGYNGLVQVTDKAVLNTLGDVASKKHIIDADARDSYIHSPDIATLPGELACLQPAPQASNITVLLPSGLDALQRMGGTLPNGLKWTAAPPAS